MELRRWKDSTKTNWKEIVPMDSSDWWHLQCQATTKR